MSPRITLILGTSNLFADAVSMAFGDYLSTRAELFRRESLWISVPLGDEQKAMLQVRVPSFEFSCVCASLYGMRVCVMVVS